MILYVIYKLTSNINASEIIENLKTLYHFITMYSNCRVYISNS